MPNEDSNRWLVVAVVALAVALVVMLILWQRDRQEAELRLDVDMGGGMALVAPVAEQALAPALRFRDRPA